MIERKGYACSECGTEIVYETDSDKNVILKDAIDKVVQDDPTRFTTRSFAVLWNEGHSIRLINRNDARWAISIPWDEIPVLREILGKMTILDSNLRYRVIAVDGDAAKLLSGPCSCYWLDRLTQQPLTYKDGSEARWPTLDEAIDAFVEEKLTVERNEVMG